VENNMEVRHMNVKRLLSGFLSVVMAVSLVTPAMAAAEPAVTFPDIETHWAKDYIVEMTQAKMFQGYTDGTFRPDNELTTAEALTLCARMVGLDQDTIRAVAADYGPQVNEILDGSGYTSWFTNSAAVCVASGILTLEELADLYETTVTVKVDGKDAAMRKLAAPLPKEELSVYVIRAMGLNGQAEQITQFSLDQFKDKASISNAAAPSVYLLYNYGIVQGDDLGNFNPKLAVNRAVMATMLSRCRKLMKDHGIVPDLAEYTDYDYDLGVIASAGGSSLTLNSLLPNGAGKTIAYGSTAKIYRYNMTTNATALKPGMIAKVCYDKDKVVTAIRLAGTPVTVEGSVLSLEDNELVLSGQAESLVLDRFTQVQAGQGGTVGDRDVVDPQAGYTYAQCTLDANGNLAAVYLTGGTKKVDGGLFQKVETTTAGKTLYVTGFDGAVRSYEMSPNVAVSIDGRNAELNNGYAGKYMDLRVNDGDGKVALVELDSATEYIRGTLRSITSGSGSVNMTISTVGGDRVSSYVTTNAVVTYDGETVKLNSLKDGYLVTARKVGTMIDRVWAYPGSGEVKGTVSAVTTSVETNANNESETIMTFQITQADGTVVSYPVSLSSGITVRRNDARANVYDVKEKDQVIFTLQNNRVTGIEATSQSANVVGTVESIMLTAQGYTLNLTLDNGEKAAYDMASGVPVRQGANELSVRDIQVGFKLGLVVEGGVVTSVEIQQGVSTATELVGKVLTIGTSSSRSFVIQTADNRNITVKLASGAGIIALSGGSSSLSGLTVGEQVRVMGKALTASEFEATVVIRLER